MRFPLCKLVTLWMASVALFAAASADFVVAIPTPTQSFEPAGDSSNTIVTWTSALPRFRLANTIKPLTGELHSLHGSAITRDSGIRMTCSRYPGVYHDFTFFNGNVPYTVQPVLTNVSYGYVGGLSYQEIFPGDTLSFEFFQSRNFVNNQPEAEWRNLTINVEVYNPVVPPAEDLGILTNGVNLQNDAVAAGQTKWYKFRILTDTLADRYLDIDTIGSTSLPNLDTSMGIYDEEGLRITTTTGSGWTHAAALSFAEPQPWLGRGAILPRGMIRNGQSGTLDTGTYYLAVAIGNQNFQPYGFSVGNGSAVSGNIVTAFLKGVDTGPTWPPTEFTNLGTISGSGSIAWNTPFLSGRWYRFTLPAIQSPGWLDLDTEGTTDYLKAEYLTTSSNNDTFLALYDVNGYALMSDASSGSEARAMLSFGDTAPRGYLNTNGFLSETRMGQHGSLAAGTYYLYVGGDTTYPSTQYPGAATTNSYCSGPIQLNARFGASNKRTISLLTVPLDWGGTDALPYYWELLDGPGGNVIESGIITADASGHLNIQVNTMSGTGYVLAVQGLHWLRAARENLNLNANVSASNALVLTNGDVDHDNEIGPGDFGELSTAFGSVEGDSNWNLMADLDGDGEVGPSDFGILSTNFGMAGY